MWCVKKANINKYYRDPATSGNILILLENHIFLYISVRNIIYLHSCVDSYFVMLFFSEVELDEDIKSDHIQWLKNNSRPWSKVQELWRITSKSRLRWLQKESITVHITVYELVSCLKTCKWLSISMYI